MQGYKRLALRCSRKLGYLTACCFTETCAEGLEGKPVQEDLQSRLPGYKRDALKILEKISLSLSKDNLPPSLSLSPSLSTSQQRKFHSGALLQGWKGDP
jgi:hypothetical protein